jgi:hypothetical protein
MIVYFLEKSKKDYMGWVIFGCLLLLIVYFMFVWGSILKREVSSIQIVRLKEGFLTKNELNLEEKRGDQQVGKGSFVASKKGVYYYPINCSRAKSLSVKNMLYFKDKTSAEQAGYKAYSGCF